MNELPTHCINLKAFRTSLNMRQKDIANKRDFIQSSRNRKDKSYIQFSRKVGQGFSRYKHQQTFI